MELQTKVVVRLVDFSDDAPYLVPLSLAAGPDTRAPVSGTLHVEHRTSDRNFVGLLEAYPVQVDSLHPEVDWAYAPLLKTFGEWRSNLNVQAVAGPDPDKPEGLIFLPGRSKWVRDRFRDVDDALRGLLPLGPNMGTVAEFEQHCALVPEAALRQLERPAEQSRGIFDVELASWRNLRAEYYRRYAMLTRIMSWLAYQSKSQSGGGRFRQARGRIAQTSHLYPIFNVNESGILEVARKCRGAFINVETDKRVAEELLATEIPVWGLTRRPAHVPEEQPGWIDAYRPRLAELRIKSNQHPLQRYYGDGDPHLVPSLHSEDEWLTWTEETAFADQLEDNFHVLSVVSLPAWADPSPPDRAFLSSRLRAARSTVLEIDARGEPVGAQPAFKTREGHLMYTCPRSLRRYVRHAQGRAYSGWVIGDSPQGVHVQPLGQGEDTSVVVTSPFDPIPDDQASGDARPATKETLVDSVSGLVQTAPPKFYGPVPTAPSFQQRVASHSTGPSSRSGSSRQFSVSSSSGSRSVDPMDFDDPRVRDEAKRVHAELEEQRLKEAAKRARRR